MSNRFATASYLRNFVFGVEDSLVSTVGLVSGVALAGLAQEQVLLTGIVLVFVEAFSMAAGSYLSERSSEEYLTQGTVPATRSILASGVMFVSYLGAGIIPIAPYAFLAGNLAFAVSVGGSLTALLILGAVGAKVSRTPVAARALQMLIVGGVAIALGIAVGQLTGLGI